MKHLNSTIAAAIRLLLGSLSYAAMGADTEPGEDAFNSREAVRDRAAKKTMNPDPFIHLLSSHTGIRERELHNLWNRGYGRNDLIKLILISKKAGTTLKEIVLQRDKKARLSAIAAKYSLDYQVVTDEALRMRKDIDTLLLGYPAAIAASSNTVETSATGENKR